MGVPDGGTASENMERGSRAQMLSDGMIWMQQSFPVGKQWEMQLARLSKSKWNAKRMMYFVNTAYLKGRPLKDF